MHRVTPGNPHALFDVAQTRSIEQRVGDPLPPNTLMQRAGLAVARLALALAPHARHIWVACGPGNNGGDGLEAAVHLKQWGKSPWVTWLGHPDKCPADAATSLKRLHQAGIALESSPPVQADLCIDALLGIGADLREPTGAMAETIRAMRAQVATVLAVDIPTGLDANTGEVNALHVQAQHTLSLLTLKPGLFTAHGRDAAGTVWLDNLGVNPAQDAVVTQAAWLEAESPRLMRPHASHKGSYGDVAVVGGATGMTGAALLAATSALHSGCGRVFVSLLDGAVLPIDVVQPDIMFSALDTLNLEQMVVVFGCGGGALPRALIERVLRSPAPVVIDADALNSIASDNPLQTLLAWRGQDHRSTVLTPHPLEAARLLGCTAQQIQADRLAAAKTLTGRYTCTVVLKGAGSIICAPGETPVINFSGNARLATAGSGDVLAGMVGALLARGLPPFLAACYAVQRHGETADQWPSHTTLTASALARAISFDD